MEVDTPLIFARAEPVADMGGRGVDAVAEMLRDPMPRFAQRSPYGDGAAAPRVADSITESHDLGRLLYKRFAADDAAVVAPWQPDA